MGQGPSARTTLHFSKVWAWILNLWNSWGFVPLLYLVSVLNHFIPFISRAHLWVQALSHWIKWHVFTLPHLPSSCCLSSIPSHHLFPLIFVAAGSHCLLLWLLLFDQDLMTLLQYEVEINHKSSHKSSVRIWTHCIVTGSWGLDWITKVIATGSTS